MNSRGSIPSTLWFCDLSLDLLLCMIMGLLEVSCCGHLALSPHLGTGGRCGDVQLLACTRETSSPAISASRVFYEALMVGNPKLAGGSRHPGVHAAKAKVVVFLPTWHWDHLLRSEKLQAFFTLSQTQIKAFHGHRSPTSCSSHFYAVFIVSEVQASQFIFKIPWWGKKEKPQNSTLYSRCRSQAVVPCF